VALILLDFYDKFFSNSQNKALTLKNQSNYCKLNMIKKGDIVDIIFPATCGSALQILSIKKYVQNIGLKPRILEESSTTPRINSNCSLSDFSAKARFKQLYATLKSPD